MIKTSEMIDDGNIYIFTFGSGQELEGKAIAIHGSCAESRSEMIKRHGNKWAFQYSLKEWREIENDPKRYWPMEEIVVEIF